MFGFRNKTDDDGEETESFPQHAMSAAVKMSRCIRCTTFFASDKLLEKHNFSDHNTHNYASDKVKSRHDQSRQKWRSHPKFLIAITLYSPLLLLCLFMVLHWCRVAQDGGPLTATTSTTSAPGRSSHNWASATFFSIAARPYDVCEMTPAYAKWLRFPRESQGLTLRCAVVSSSRSHPRGKMKLRVYAKLAFRSVFDDATKMPACWKLSCTGLLMIAAGCPNDLARLLWTCPSFVAVALQMMFICTVRSYGWERAQDRPLETSKLFQYKHAPNISTLALRAAFWVALYVCLMRHATTNAWWRAVRSLIAKFAPAQSWRSRTLRISRQLQLQLCGFVSLLARTDDAVFEETQIAGHPCRIMLHLWGFIRRVLFINHFPCVVNV